jgi:hypothetical protein
MKFQIKYFENSWTRDRSLKQSNFQEDNIEVLIQGEYEEETKEFSGKAIVLSQKSYRLVEMH